MGFFAVKTAKTALKYFIFGSRILSQL